nr:MAG TPA: hypothetical protein [Caudoviricetes sp.]
MLVLASHCRNFLRSEASYPPSLVFFDGSF